jgi:hypothetical protein
VVACNPACRQRHGKPYCESGAGEPGNLPAPILDEDVLREFVRTGYRVQGHLVPCADHTNGAHENSSRAGTPVVLYLLGQRQGDQLVRIWGIEFEATGLGAQDPPGSDARFDARDTGSNSGGSPEAASQSGDGLP